MMNKENIECCDINIIVSDFYNHLKKYLMGKIHNNELAEDIVQDIMLKVISSHKNNIQVRNIKAWLFQIARNTLIDYYRKKQNHVQQNQEYIDEVLIELQDKSFTPEDYLIPMINLLPQKYSNPLLLSDIENLPQAEIAQKIGISLSATKMRILRARKMLYNLFIECCNIKYADNGAFLNCTIKESCAPLIKL